MASMIKTEQDIPIKPDPEDAVPARFVDDFDYEDTGELEIPKEQIHAWLLRLPKELHAKWANIPDNQVIQVGHVRQFKGKNKVRKQNKQGFTEANSYLQWELHLNPTLEQHQGISKRYDMRTTGQDIPNTFVFSEKDLPGLNSKGKSKAHLSGVQTGRANGRDRVDKGFRYQGWSRKAVPSELRITLDNMPY